MKNTHLKWLLACCWLLPALALAQVDRDKPAQKKADVFDLKIRVSPVDTITCATQSVEVVINYKNLAGQTLFNFEVHAWFPNELTKYFVFDKVIYAPGNNREPSLDFCRIDHAIWNVGTLQVNQQDSIIFRLHLARRPNQFTTFMYRAEIRTRDQAGDNLGSQVSIRQIFAPKNCVGSGEPPDLRITKRANRNTASVGDEVLFSLTVSNAPNVADQINVVVEDRVPAGLLVDAARVDPSPSSIETLPNGSQLIRWSFPGAFPANASRTLTVPATVTLNPVCRETLNNFCQANGDVPELNCSNTDNASITVVPKYDFRLEFMGDSLTTVAPGEPQKYALKITNFSTVGVNNLDLLVSIDDALPLSNCYTITEFNGGTPRDSNTKVSWTISRIDSGATDTLFLKLHYDKIQYTEWGQKIKFVAQIDSIFCNIGDSRRADNTDRWERIKDFDIDLVLEPAPENDMPDASFDITKSYHFVVRNASPVDLPLTNLHVTLNPLPGTDPNRIVINGVNGVRPIPPWTIPPLAAGASSSNMLNISIDAVCDTGAYGFTIAANVDPVPNETNTANNRRTWQTKAESKYDLQLEFVGEPVKRILPDMEERYDLEVKNSSTLRIDSVLVELVIDDGLTPGNCYSIKPGGVDEVSASEDTVRWLIRLLDPGKTVTRSVTLKYDKLDSLKLGQSVHFVATAGSVFCNLPDAKPADNTDRWVRTKGDHFDLVLDPAPENKRSARFGVPEIYHLTVINASTDSVPATTLNIKLASLDPRGTTLIDMQVNGMRVSDLDTTWAIPALAPNQRIAEPFNITVHAPQDSGRYCFQMVAWVDTLANESDSTNNRREWETCVGPVYDVRVKFTGEKQGQISPNQTERYKLEVINLSTFRVDSVHLVLNINDSLANRNCYSIIGNNDNGIPSPDSAKVEWLIDTLAAGDTVTRSLTLKYDKIEASSLGKSVSFLAEVDTLLQGQPDQKPDDNTADWVRTKRFTIDIELDSLKSNNRLQASFDDPQPYQLIVKNNSDVTTPACSLRVNLVPVNETLPSHIAIDGVSKGLQKSREIKSLVPGASDTVKFTITIAAHDRSGIYGFDMIATVDALPGEIDTANNHRVWQTRVNAAFDLQIAFTGDRLGQIAPHAVEKYEIEVRNLSKFRVDRALLKVRINDDMAGSNCYTIGEISDEGTSSQNGQLVQWLIETLAAGDTVRRSFPLEYDKIQHTDLGKSVVFSAEVDTSYRGESDRNSLDNFDRWERTKQFPLDLEITAVPENNRPNARFDSTQHYRLTVKNVSAVQVPSTTLNVELIPYSLNPATQPNLIDMRVGTIRVNDLDTSWVIPALAPDSSSTRFFDATIFAHDAPGNYGFTMHAWIDTLANESDSTNNRRQWQTTVRHHPGFDLVLDFDGAKLDTIGPGAVEPYELVVTNRSSFRVDGARLELRIDAERICYRIEDISHAGINQSDTLVQWQLGPLEPGAIVKPSLKLIYDAIEFSDLSKRVEFFAFIDTAYAGLPDLNPGDNFKSWERVKDFKIDLVLESILANNHPNAGFNTPEPYRFIVRNASDVPLHDLKLCVKLDTLLGTLRKRIQILPNPPGDLDTCWTIAALAPNDTTMRDLKISILAQDCPDSGAYGFTMAAWVDTVVNESDIANNRREWQTTALLKYDLQLAFLGKSTDSISPGQVEPYELVVRNRSSIRLDSLSLLLTINDGMGTSDCYTIRESDGGDTLVSGQVSWVIPSLAPDDSVKRTLSLYYNKIQASDLGKRVQFTAQLDTLPCGQPDRNPTNNARTWERIKDFTIDLALDCAAPNNRQTRFDSTETYSLTVTNVSKIPLPATRLHVKLDKLNDATAPDSIILDGVRQLMTIWPILPLEPDSSFTQTFTAVIRTHNEPGIYGFKMQACVDSIPGESDTTNNCCMWQTTVTLRYDVSLKLSDDPPGNITPNATKKYALEINNRSTERLDSLRVTLEIDDGMLNGDCYTVVESGGAILGDGLWQWRLGPLDSGATVIRFITLQYDKIESTDLGRRVKLTARVDTLLHGQRDQNPADNTARLERTVEFAFDLMVDASPENIRLTCFDTPEEYRVTVRNASDVLMRNIKLQMSLSLIGNTSGSRIDIANVSGLDTTCMIDSLTAHGIAACVINVKIAAHDDPGTYGFMMKACADVIANESDTTNNCREWRTTVTSEVRLSMTPIDLTPTPFKFADTLTYTFQYKNESTCNFVVRDATLKLTIPEAAIFLSATVKTPTGQIELMPDTSIALGDLRPGFNEGEATIKLRVFNREDLLDKYRGQASINLVFEATASSRNAGSVSQSRTDALPIPPFAEAFYLSHNLFRPELDNAVELYIDVTDNTAVRFKIYNLAGELVRSFPPQQVRIGGRVSALWDGRNDRGDYVGSGLYFVFAEVDYKRERPSRRLVVVR